MKRIVMAAALGILALGLVVPASPVPPEKPEAVLQQYFTAIKAERFDQALALLSLEFGDYYFGRSFVYARTDEETANPEAWVQAIRSKEELNRLLPFWRQRAFTVAIQHTLVVGKHARVFFTYSNGSDPTRAFQDFIYEEGAWRLCTAL